MNKDNEEYIKRLKYRINLFFVESCNLQNGILAENVFHPIPNLHKIINAIDHLYPDNVDIIFINTKIKTLTENHKLNEYPLKEICIELLSIIKFAKLDMYKMI